MKREKLKKDNEKKKMIKLARKKSKLDGLKEPFAPPLPDRNELFSEAEMEVEVKRRMQDQLAFNSDIFVLNQMMMSVQFFANYERFVGNSFSLSITHPSFPPIANFPRKQSIKSVASKKPPQFAVLAIIFHSTLLRRYRVIEHVFLLFHWSYHPERQDS